MELPEKPLRVLFIEDSVDDAELEALELEKAGFRVDYRRVSDAEELEAALAAETFDLAIADHHMPGFGGLEALRLIRAARSEMPVLLVSGTIGESAAVEAIKAGADDYVLKDNLTRLGHAASRGLETAASRRERRRAERDERLLTALSKVLPESLDLATTLSNLAQVVLAEGFAEWCVFDVLDGGRLVRSLVRHRDPAMTPWAEKLQHEFAPDPAARGAWEVLRSGKPLLLAEIAENALPGLTPNPAHQEVLRQLGLRSLVTVPLRPRGETLATFSLVRSHEQHFDERDLRLAVELANRAGLAVENARLYRAAQEAIAVRDEFLAIASHELRTPLTALRLQIDGMKRVLSRPDAPQLDPRFVRRLDQAVSGVERLGTLVDHLLDVSRLSVRGVPLEIADVDLAEVAADVADRLRPEAAQAGSTVSVDATPVHGRWDRLRLEQVLTNLLGNAVKYGLGGPIELSVRRVGERAVACVRDRGIGIAESELPRLFERFERAASIMNYGGLGLGLFIARRIVEAHGGTIRAMAREGGGAEFVMELPLEVG